MKTLIIILICLPFSMTYGQDASAYLADARQAYASSDYESARVSLQNALYEIDKVIATKIIEALPTSLGSLQVDKSKDTNEGTGTSMGLFVTRIYGSKDASYAELNITDNSPMVGMVNAFLSNPMLSSIASQSGGQKMVKIDGYKGMMQKEADEDGDYSIMVPFGDSMLTLETNIQDESQVIAMAEQIPLAEIVAIVD